jgi:hypothetical protein
MPLTSLKLGPLGSLLFNRVSADVDCITGHILPRDWQTASESTVIMRKQFFIFDSCQNESE